MARLTRVFGVVLIVLGIVYFVLTGSQYPTPLIPAVFGVLLVVCGFLANTEDTKRRMLWMHIAVSAGLVGFLFPAIRGGMALLRNVSLTEVQHTAAQEEIVMAVICGAFTALCVRSFIVARVGRTAAV